MRGAREQIARSGRLERQPPGTGRITSAPRSGIRLPPASGEKLSQPRWAVALAELEAAGRAGTVRGARGEMSSRRWIRRLPALAAGSEIAAGKLKQVWQRGSQYRRYRQSYVV